MAGKKGIIPNHIKMKTFTHPQAEHPLVHIFTVIEDPRKPSLNFQHSLTSVLFMTLVAILCGSSDWEQIVIACEGMKEWLAKYVDMSAGVPCERTFKNVFSALNPKSLEKALQEFASTLREKITGEVICFDGQTSCGTVNKNKELRGIHLLNVWSASNKICLAQIKVPDKSNEIPAMLELLDQLNLEEAIITADAMNTQKANADRIIEGKGDYVFPLKKNHETLFNDVELLFEGLGKEQEQKKDQWDKAMARAEKNRDCKQVKKLMSEQDFSCGSSFWESGSEKAHGRIEKRTCTAISIGSLPSKEDWKGLKSVARITRERVLEGVTSQEVVLYISSLPPDAKIIAGVVRDHWGVENSLHWRLDVQFGQDASRYRERNGAANLAVIRKMVLNALSKEKTLKKGMATKQCAAAHKPEYREKVLKNLF